MPPWYWMRRYWMTQSISHTILNENDAFNITHAWSCAENWILKNKIPGTRFWIFALNDEWSTFLKSIYQKGNINHWLGRAVIHQNHPSKSSIKKIHQNHPTKSSIKIIGWVVFRNFTYPSAPLRAVFLFFLLSWWKSLSSWKSLAWYLVKDGWDQNHRSTSSGEWYLMSGGVHHCAPCFCLFFFLGETAFLGTSSRICGIKIIVEGPGEWYSRHVLLSGECTSTTAQRNSRTQLKVPSLDTPRSSLFYTLQWGGYGY